MAKTTTLKDIQNEAIRSALLEIAETNGGRIAPSAVVEAATDPVHILHEYFQWDNDAAAAEYRLAQAGCLIRRVKFHVMKETEDAKTVNFTTVRAFQSRPSQRTEDGGYETVESIMESDAAREEMLQAALSELEAFERRYAQLQELAVVLVAIKKVVYRKAGKAGSG